MQLQWSVRDNDVAYNNPLKLQLHVIVGVRFRLRAIGRPTRYLTSPLLAAPTDAGDRKQKTADQVPLRLK